jgi:1-acyl-sn-glycerol-3-phosphate acyltransferase
VVKGVKNDRADQPSKAAKINHSELRLFERVALSLARVVNETRCGKRWQSLYMRSVGYSWIWRTCAYRTLAEGLDTVAGLAPKRGVLFVSNHRTFFDQYAMTIALLMGPTAWAQKFYFPVRSNLFYDHPLGLLLNLAATAGVMYPPIFRQKGRSDLNKDSIRRIVGVLGESGAIVGMHPEGLRNKNADPYRMLSARYGVGQIALQASPMVIPVFMNGLTNDFKCELLANRTPNVRHHSPIIIVFGSPLDLQKFSGNSRRLSTYKAVADFFNDEILALSAHERALRLQCALGAIPDDDQRWLSNRGAPRFYARPTW